MTRLKITENNCAVWFLLTTEEKLTKEKGKLSKSNIKWIYNCLYNLNISKCFLEENAITAIDFKLEKTKLNFSLYNSLCLNTNLIHKLRSCQQLS